MADQWGAFIWYELMTTDPDGAKAFYDAVVGWDIQRLACPGGITDPVLATQRGMAEMPD